jgi:putative transposase
MSDSRTDNVERATSINRLHVACGVRGMRGMGRPPRYVPPGSMVEITARTNDGQLLLRPCPELNARILEILGRALDLYPVALHAFVFLSNHWHALATVADAEQLASFLRYVNGNVAKAAKAIHGFGGVVWERRASVIAVVDDDSAEERYRYILAHGAKEGLVRSPLEWPGVSSARALAFGDTLEGIRPGRRIGSPIIERYPIPLARLPGWAALSDAEVQARTLGMVHEIEQQAARTHPCILGAAAVLQQSPLDRHQLDRRAAPQVHAAQSSARARFLAARIAFYEAYRAAADDLRSALAVVADTFPPGSFPPRPPLSSVPNELGPL